MRVLKVFVPILSIAIIVLALGFTSLSSADETNFNLNMASNPSFDIDSMPTKEETVEVKFKKQKSDLKTSKIDLGLKVNKQGELKISGSGKLQIGKDEYSISLNEDASQIVQSTYEGKIYYRTVLEGNITLKDESTVISIISYFSEDGKDKFCNVVIGSIGNDIYLSFGDNSFLTQELWEAITHINLEQLESEVNS